MIKVNDVFRDLNSREFRVLSYNESLDKIYFIYLDSRRIMPTWLSTKDLEEAFDNGDIVKIEDRFLKIISDKDLDKVRKNNRDRIYSVIDPAWQEYKEELVVKKKRTTILQKIAFDNDIPYSSMRRHISRFWQRGMNRNAFLADYQYCGTYDRSKVVYTKKAGRPKLLNAFMDVPEGINIDDKIKDIIKCMATKKYPQANRPSKEDVYKEMIRLCFSDKVTGENGTIEYKIWCEDRLPSHDQFYYWMNKFSDTRHDIEERFGEIEYYKNHRAKTSNTVFDSLGPCHMFEIDATIADIYLLSSRYPGRVIGRPVIYFVVDVFSRMICGLYVGLEGPSWMGAAMALMNTAINKKEFCAWNGIDIEESEWPARHFPDILMADNGELISNNIADLESIFGLHMKNHASYRADLKGTVERKFGIFNGRIKNAGTPGAVMKEFGERGAKRPQLDAALTLEDFVKMVIRIILELNKTTMKNYPYTQEMALAGIKLTPIDIWNWGLNNKRGLVKTIENFDQYMMALLPKVNATISDEGLSFKTLRYESKRFFEENWHLRKEKNVKLAYDPRLVDHVYVIESANLMDFEIMELCPPDQEYAGWSFNEVKYMRDLVRDQNKKSAHSDLQSSIDTITANKQTAKEAVKKKKELPEPISKADVMSGIQSNRAAESHENRQAEAFRPGQPRKLPESKIEANIEEDDDSQNALSIYSYMEEEDGE